MQNSNIEAQTFKNQAYEAFAEVAKALSSHRRLELVDLLVQGPRAVDGLARVLGQSVSNVSQHLQVLKRARVVETRRIGTTIEYRLAPGTAEAFAVLRRLAEARSPELVSVKERFYRSAQAVDTIDRESLTRRLGEGSAVLIDVRPRDEYEHGHVDGALSFPLDQLEQRVEELPIARLIVATCRGPYCVFAADAVRLLRARGRDAVRFEDGVAEWRLDEARETGVTM